MSYFDRRSPSINIHTPRIESTIRQPERFPNGHFPSIIRSRELESNILGLWTEARKGSPSNRFLYAYRVIEYASFVYIEQGARSNIRRMLSAPNALDSVDLLMQSILGEIHPIGLNAADRFDSLVREAVTPKRLWQELSRNASAFEQPTLFDGGFTIEAVMKDLKNEGNFTNNSVTAFCRRLRDIRNALSHGQDQRSRLPLTPTSHNQERLQPWAAAVSFIAGEVIVYRDAH